MKKFLFIFIISIGVLWAIIGATFERIVFGKNNYYS